MRLGKVLVALALTAPFCLGTPSKADFLTGSIAFSSDSTLITLPPGGNDILTATAFSFSTVAGGANTQATAAPATGSFAGVPANTIINSSQLTLTSSPELTLNLGGPTGDFFIATTIASDASGGANSRTIELDGLISGPGFTTTPGHFILNFSQSGGPGNAIGYSGTLSAVPEPASLTLLGVGALGAWRLVRRKPRRPVGIEASEEVI